MVVSWVSFCSLGSSPGCYKTLSVRSLGSQETLLHLALVCFTGCSWDVPWDICLRLQLSQAWPANQGAWRANSWDLDWACLTFTCAAEDRKWGGAHVLRQHHMSLHGPSFPDALWSQGEVCANSSQQGLLKPFDGRMAFDSHTFTLGVGLDEILTFIRHWENELLKVKGFGSCEVALKQHGLCLELIRGLTVIILLDHQFIFSHSCISDTYKSKSVALSVKHQLPETDSASMPGHVVLIRWSLVPSAVWLKYWRPSGSLVSFWGERVEIFTNSGLWGAVFIEGRL